MSSTTEAPGESLIGSAEAASTLGVDRATLLRWVERGTVTAAHKMPGTSGAYLFTRAEINRLARARTAQEEGAA